jgi:hypothetical protein
MCCVEGNAEEYPSSKDTRAFRRVFVETKHPHHRKKKAIHHRRPSTEIIQFLRQCKIPRMKHTAKHPTREAKIAKAKIKLPEWVTARNPLPQNFHTVIVSEEIEQRKDDGKRFLHAEETVKGPFAVELEDWFAVRGFAGEAGVGYDVLAGVVAFGGAGPEEEAVLECCVGWVCELLLFFVSCVWLLPVFPCSFWCSEAEGWVKAYRSRDRRVRN